MMWGAVASNYFSSILDQICGTIDEIHLNELTGMIISENSKLDLSSHLLDKLKTKDAVIGIIGLGYVGLPLSLSYAEAGFKTIGFDIDDNKINSLNNQTSYIKHIAENY